MDSRRFEVTLNTMGMETKQYVDTEDVVISEGFVIFIRVDDENKTTETVAMFNNNCVESVKEIKTND